MTIALKSVKTGEVFPSISAAAKARGYNVRNFTRAVRKTGYYKRESWQTLPFYHADDHTWRKAVRCVETGEVFPCCAPAADKYWMSTSAIRKAAQTGKTSAGLHWEYVEASE